jgi:hypothetical protein
MGGAEGREAYVGADERGEDDDTGPLAVITGNAPDACEESVGRATGVPESTGVIEDTTGAGARKGGCPLTISGETGGPGNG